MSTNLRKGIENSPNDPQSGPEADFVSDPLSDKLWDEWCGRATTNTEVFRTLFHADPDDNILTFEDYDKFTPNPKTDKEHKQGHLYDMIRPVAEIPDQMQDEGRADEAAAAGDEDPHVHLSGTEAARYRGRRRGLARTTSCSD